MPRPTRRFPSPPLLAGVLVIAGVIGAVAAGVAGLSAPGGWGVVCLATGAVAGLWAAIAFASGRWMAAVHGALFVAAIGLVVLGGVLATWTLVGLGVLGVVIVGVGAPLTLALDRMSGVPGGERAPGLEQLLRQIHEHSMLSDNAKRVLFRERELGLLRDAIEGDIVEGKYNAALALCEEMAEVFGYREDAEAFRERIVQARQQHYEAAAHSAIAHLDELLERRDWAQVHHEAARIRRLYGDSHLVHDLDARILEAREAHKRELEGRFLDAAEREDVEGAMGLLKQLDRYLDQEEAARLTEVAQGVVTRHRENLGVQFKLAVSDHRWAEATRIGETIVAEFPNTKMAGEVRSMLDRLRRRADEATVAGG
ncbi:MAG: hypothetical protein HKO59_15485 [Phycisphaerales bacterium]|nr:TMEM198/TM7SF3 family protein [Phycisphaerae bacterium]NNM27359.1 hypothetical protein [Phycisphaerales bacterium]